jgi:hypothetical protein|tara:strand:+ start:307 stop:867 length:561 start_codon:yes stop_codon:yes gene_type:complete
MTTAVSTQNTLLLNNLMKFYRQDKNLDKMLAIINGESNISLRIVDWFATNYAKQYFTAIPTPDMNNSRFKVFVDYKLRLRAYSKKRFDPFCRWERISIPYNKDQYVQTTIGQLNFFKWALENKVIDYIEENYVAIENDMNKRNSTSKRKKNLSTSNQKTRKKREELSVLASKSIYKEDVNIIVKFD